MEPLGALKKKTNSDLIQKQFEAVVKYGAGIKAFYEGFQALRKPFDDLASAEHMTVDQQVEAVIKLGEELGKHATVLGKNANIILDSRSDIWKVF
jgi:phage-related minor tail protein